MVVSRSGRRWGPRTRPGAHQRAHVEDSEARLLSQRLGEGGLARAGRTRHEDVGRSTFWGRGHGYPEMIGASSVGGHRRAEAAAGALSGVACRLIVAPLDLLKIRFQLQRAPVGSAAVLRSLFDTRRQPADRTYTSLFQATKRIVQEEGYSALWRLVCV